MHGKVSEKILFINSKTNAIIYTIGNAPPGSHPECLYLGTNKCELFAHTDHPPN